MSLPYQGGDLLQWFACLTRGGIEKEKTGENPYKSPYQWDLGVIKEGVKFRIQNRLLGEPQ